MKGKGKGAPNQFGPGGAFGGDAKGGGKSPGWYFAGKKGKGPIGFLQQQPAGPCAFLTAGLLAASAIQGGRSLSLGGSPLYVPLPESELPPLPFDLPQDPYSPMKVVPEEPAYVPLWSVSEDTSPVPLFPLTRGNVWSFTSEVEGLI